MNIQPPNPEQFLFSPVRSENQFSDPRAFWWSEGINIACFPPRGNQPGAALSCLLTAATLLLRITGLFSSPAGIASSGLRALSSLSQAHFHLTYPPTPFQFHFLKVLKSTHPKNLLLLSLPVLLLSFQLLHNLKNILELFCCYAHGS